MKQLRTNDFDTITIPSGSSVQLVDILDIGGKKTITLSEHSSLVYLVVAKSPDIHIDIITGGSHSSCKIFGIYVSDISHALDGSLNVALNHSFGYAEVEMFSFLYDGARVQVNGNITIADHLEQVSGRLFQKNIVLGGAIQLHTSPQLMVASADTRASHGASIDALDDQRLFYIMSRGLSKHQAQKLLVDGYMKYIFSHFGEMSDEELYVLNTAVIAHK